MRVRFAAVLAIAGVFLSSGCGSVDRPAGPERATAGAFIVDADAYGVITYEPVADRFRGFDSAGREKWARTRISAADVGCAGHCPNAFFAGATSRNFLVETGVDKPVVGAQVDRLLWARTAKEWVGIAGSRLVRQGSSVPLIVDLGLNSQTAVGRESPDGGTYLISQPDKDTRYSVWVLDLRAPDARPRELAGGLAGPVGCVAPDSRSVVTSGPSSARLSIVDRSAKPLSGAPKLTSSCRIGRQVTVLASLSASSADQRRGEIYVTDGKSTSPILVMPIADAPEVTGKCAVFVSGGRLLAYSLTGRMSAVASQASDATVLPDDRIVVLDSAGSPRFLNPRETRSMTQHCMV